MDTTTAVAEVIGGNGMTAVGEIFTNLTTWMGSIVTTMTAEGNELMLLPIGIFAAGAVIGLASRLIGR